MFKKRRFFTSINKQFKANNEINPKARISWDGWSTGIVSQYNAHTEQTLQPMNTTLMKTFLMSGLGIAWNIADIIADPLISAARPGQTSIWLKRTTWLKNDYTTYRRQDRFYSDENYSSIMYTDSVRKYVGGNK